MFGGAIVEPQSPLFWVASSSVTYEYIRVAIMGALAILLFTRPPRRTWARALTGSIAVVTVVWAIQQTYSYHMLPFDTLSIVGASIAIIVTILEVDTVELKFIDSRA